MEDSTGALRSVSAGLGNGQHWLELNDAGSGLAQTLGIKSSVQTVAGAQYSLSFDYAGRLGFSTAYTQIGIYVDGQRIGSHANTSSNTELNWQAVNVQFIGTGQTQTLQIVIEAPSTHAGGRGAMIDDIQLIQTQQLNRGVEDHPNTPCLRAWHTMKNNCKELSDERPNFFMGSGIKRSMAE